METFQELNDWLEVAEQPELELEEIAIEVVTLPEAIERFAASVMRTAVNLQLRDADHPDAIELFTALGIFRRETGT